MKIVNHLILVFVVVVYANPTFGNKDASCIQKAAYDMVKCIMGSYSDLQELGGFEVMKILQTGDRESMRKLCKGSTIDEIILCNERAVTDCPALAAATGSNPEDLRNAKESINYMCKNFEELQAVLPCFQKSTHALQACKVSSDKIRLETERDASCRALEWEIACSIGAVSNEVTCNQDAVDFLRNMEIKQRPIACRNPDEITSEKTTPMPTAEKTTATKLILKPPTNKGTVKITGNYIPADTSNERSTEEPLYVRVVPLTNSPGNNGVKLEVVTVNIKKPKAAIGKSRDRIKYHNSSSGCSSVIVSMLFSLIMYMCYC